MTRTTPSSVEPSAPSGASRWWLLAFIAAALNLRAPVVVLGPLLAPIMAALDLGASQASLLSAGMVICFGLLSPFAPTAANRLGLDRALALALTAIALGGMLRAVPQFGVMLVGTLIAGAGIAFGNVFLPSLVKRDRPSRIGATMGLYAVVMGIGATLAAGSAIPLMQLSGSWQGPLLLFGLFGVVSSIGWWALALRQRGGGSDTEAPSLVTQLRNPTAWMLTLFMGLQSLGFYTLQAWVPVIAIDGGVSPLDAGWMLSLINLTTLPISYLTARWAARLRRPNLLAVAMTALVAVAIAGLTVAPASAPMLWATLLGVGQGGCFTLALTLIVLRSRTPTEVATLSAMAHCIGYTIAAAGPVLFGALRTLSGSWTPSLLAMLVVLALQALAGYAVGHSRPTAAAR